LRYRGTGHKGGTPDARVGAYTKENQQLSGEARMTHEQRGPNGAGTAGNAQGDGDNRPMKEASPDAQKALDAATSEPRNAPPNGHNGGEKPGASAP